MTSPIREVLQTLSRHAQTVENSLLGVVSGDAGTPEAAIAALRQASALRPAGEDGYRLHPRLREYLQDHLSLFSAFQSLSEIGPRITQLGLLWTEIELVRLAADTETLASLTTTLQMTVFDIADSMDGNLLLLHLLMSTRFGNVRTLEAKKSQNRYYQQQTTLLAGDLARLAQAADRLEREASERAMEELARFLRRNLLGRLTAWQQGVSEMQTLIRKEIFSIREVEKHHKLLARTDLLLRQQPAWRGIEPDLGGEIPDFLLAAALAPLQAHVEPLDSDRAVRDELQALVRALPPKASAPPEAQPPRRYTRITDAPRVPVVTPAAQALERLARQVQASPEGVPLAAWREGDADALSMAPAVWLVFAVMALRGRRMHVELRRNAPAGGGHFAHTFGDAVAYARAPATVAAQAPEPPAARLPVSGVA
jgi:hypothetical protein